MSDLPYAKKSLGQHWLNDQSSLEAICKAGEITASDTVLEIGPGLGSLTKLLVERAQKVIAVEFDERLAHDLPIYVTSDKLEVRSEDILKFDLTKLPAGYKVVANIPYYLTSHLIKVLSESANPAERVTLLIQKEVAERVTAQSGNMSLLGVSAQYYWKVSLGQVVKAELFTPPPKVDSQVLVLQHREKPLFTDVDAKQFFRVVKAGFAGKRKTLHNSLSAGLGIDKTTTGNILQLVHLDPMLRAQNLSLDDWHNLYEVLLFENLI